MFTVSSKSKVRAGVWEAPFCLEYTKGRECVEFQTLLGSVTFISKMDHKGTTC